MKDKKYYTPEISEFHVGFEFQDKNYPENDNAWTGRPYTLRAEYELDTVQDRIDKNQIRVKHLDQSDIESLGWEYMEKMVREEHDYEVLDCWEIPVDATENKEKYYVLFIYKEKLHIEYHEYQNSVGRTEDTLFKGTIKNKSELIKLLKQLGI